MLGKLVVCTIVVGVFDNINWTNFFVFFSISIIIWPISLYNYRSSLVIWLVQTLVDFVDLVSSHHTSRLERGDNLTEKLTLLYSKFFFLKFCSWILILPFTCLLSWLVGGESHPQTSLPSLFLVSSWSFNILRVKFISLSDVK